MGKCNFIIIIVIIIVIIIINCEHTLVPPAPEVHKPLLHTLTPSMAFSLTLRVRSVIDTRFSLRNFEERENPLSTFALPWEILRLIFTIVCTVGYFSAPMEFFSVNTFLQKLSILCPGVKLNTSVSVFKSHHSFKRRSTFNSPSDSISEESKNTKWKQYINLPSKHPLSHFLFLS